MAVSDRTMFEIYREAGYDRRYRVVYFTELDEHNKEQEINRAMAGEHFYDGFISDLHKTDAKKRIAQIVERLNRGEALTPADVDRELAAVEGTPNAPEPSSSQLQIPCNPPRASSASA